MKLCIASCLLAILAAGVFVGTNAAAAGNTANSEWVAQTDESTDPRQWKNRRDPVEFRRQACEYRSRAPYVIAASRDVGLPIGDAIADAVPFLGFEIALTTARKVYADVELKDISEDIYERCMAGG